MRYGKSWLEDMGCGVNKKIKIIIGAAALAAIIGGVYFSYKDDAGGTLPAPGKITAEQAKEMLAGNADFILLDVRTEEEYKEKHIEGALLIPDYEIASRAETQLPDKDAIILVYCRSGHRSENAASVLADLGYVNVYDFGGIQSWPYETVSE